MNLYYVYYLHFDDSAGEQVRAIVIESDSVSNAIMDFNDIYDYDVLKCEQINKTKEN